MDYNAGADYGYIWLNRIFVKRGSHIRLWKTSDIRLSRFEIIVMSVLLLVFLAISFPIIALLMRWSFISDHISLWPLMIGTIFAAWWAGRALAKASPYSKYTGENIFDYLAVVSDNDRRNTLLGRIVGHRVAVNEVTTWVKGRPQPVEAVEWIGSARAPSAPPRTADMLPTDLVDVTLRPQVEATNWVDQVRRARRGDPFARSMRESAVPGPTIQMSTADGHTHSSQPLRTEQQ